VRPEHLNDDVPGRAFDKLYEHDVTALFSGLGAQVAQRLGLRGSTVHLDSTRFHADGEYDYEPEAGGIEITQGYSRDHRAELNQAVLNLLVEQRADQGSG
jgi:transposase